MLNKSAKFDFVFIDYVKRWKFENNISVLKLNCDFLIIILNERLLVLHK